MSGFGLAGVTKRYGELSVLEGASAAFETGRCHVILGPSGAGKTTALRLLAGLERPDSGEVARSAGARLAMTFQEDRLCDKLTATANIRLPEGLLAPAFGVYAARVTLPDGTVYPAVTNVGVRPTVGDQLGTLAEAWIMDYDGLLYGQTIHLAFYRYLRPEKRFSDLDALRAEVLHNAQQTRDYFTRFPQ